MSTERKRGRKPSKDPYFGHVEELAVKEFLSLGSLIHDSKSLEGYRWTGSTKDEFRRNEIYRQHLQAPLNKMIESIIRRYKLYSKSMTFEDLHSDTLSFLMMKFHKFKPSKGKKSYSYYGTVCKHYLLGKLIKDDKKLKTLISYEDIAPDLEENEEYSYEIDNQELDLTLLIDEISTSIKEELQNKILTENEIKVGNALVSILENWENVFEGKEATNKYNKNLILYYMREMTSLSTKDIRNAMKRYRGIYKFIKDGGL
ncbi:MAG: hypothetical protein ACK5OW_00420 [bacterium]|jgi:hypothetical protein